MKVALSVGVQRMVRADKAGAGVMFSIDTETGFPRTVLINAAWGLGETVVQGTVDPDEYTCSSRCSTRSSCADHREAARRQGAARWSTAKGSSDWTRPVDEERARVRARRRRGPDARPLGLAIEDHYGQPMDIEWAKDGETGELFIVQARPRRCRRASGGASCAPIAAGQGPVLVTGTRIGDAIAAGKVCI
jgi:pyruvate, water dikinase